MKYKDYLIIPIIAMYLLFASCALVSKVNASNDGPVSEPEASVSPTEICWNDELWYEEGSRNGDCFIIKDDSFVYINGQNQEEGRYTIADMHLECRSTDGGMYDLIFVDEMTAYDVNSGTYYQRADYDSLKSQLISGRFVNSENPKDYYVFKDNGKSIEYFGDKIFKGNWNLSTSTDLTVYDKQCRQNFDFNLIFAGNGIISGFSFNEIVYNLET